MFVEHFLMFNAESNKLRGKVKSELGVTLARALTPLLYNINISPPYEIPDARVLVFTFILYSHLAGQEPSDRQLDCS